MASFVSRIVYSPCSIHLYLFITTVVEASVHVKHVGEGLTFVPQNISSNVTKLDLGSNDIEVLNRTRFSLFEKMNWLSLDRNPLEIINNGTFDNNPLLTVFECLKCKIKVLPTPFGPAASQIRELSWIQGVRDTRCITSTYLEKNHFFESSRNTVQLFWWYWPHQVSFLNPKTGNQSHRTIAFTKCIFFEVPCFERAISRWK